MAFDFFDRKDKTFVSREYLARMLEGTGISQVPLIELRGMISRSELLGYMKRQSAYYGGPIEGVYVRFENEKRSITEERGKIVRSDFIAGNEHWSKGETQMNALRLLDA
jgi:atypical dual specificity phosphatase